MKIKNVLRAVSAAAVLAGASLSASAGLVVLDGWQMATPGGITTNIGRLNLVSATSTVEQEINGLGQAFVGAKFVENGVVFSLTYTPENVVGAGDSGSPALLTPFQQLTITFSNVAGHITALNSGGGFHYSFDSGSFLLSSTNGGNLAAGAIVGIGGNLGSTGVIGGVNGDSAVLALVGAYLNPLFDLKDSTGTSLAADLFSGKVLFEAVLNNNITSATPGGTGPLGACSFTTDVAGDACLTASVASAGDAYLVRDIPEPGSIALLGLGLLGLGAMRRRQSAK